MIQAISRDAANDAFHQCILQRTSLRSEQLFDAPALVANLELD
jgi:hypothetical protein